MYRMTVFERILLISWGIILWFSSQSFLSTYLTGTGNYDTLHYLLSSLNEYANNTPIFAEILLVSSGIMVDIAAITIICMFIIGILPIRTIMAMFSIFAFRQICQILVALPAPNGMVWFTPRIPSLLVTYSTGSDFYFSGHTSICAFMLFTLWSRVQLSKYIQTYLIIQLIWQIICIMILRSHWTQDIITGILVAWIAS